ncbi:hypothetical protein KXW58_006124 [Aspergillus fumigatus]|nr:hypothetical protein KXW58_006124 [Aspergillus fumigatus]
MANIITPTRNTESFTPINDGRRMPVFIKRLVTALNDQQNQQIMRWSEDGNTVVIVDEQELTTKLLSKFNTTTYYSFTQQLKLHGFRKVKKGYDHPLFRRDHPQDMYLIQRKDGKPLPPSSFGSGMLSPSDVANVRSPSSISTPGSSVGYSSAQSSPNHPHPLSLGNGVSNEANSRGQNYKVVKRGRKPKTLMQTQQYSDWVA